MISFMNNQEKSVNKISIVNINRVTTCIYLVIQYNICNMYIWTERTRYKKDFENPSNESLHQVVH